MYQNRCSSTNRQAETFCSRCSDSSQAPSLGKQPPWQECHGAGGVEDGGHGDGGGEDGGDGEEGEESKRIVLLHRHTQKHTKHKNTKTQHKNTQTHQTQKHTHTKHTNTD